MKKVASVSVTIAALSVLGFYNIFFLFGGDAFGQTVSEQKRKGEILNSNLPVKIGYFHGGKTYALYRTYMNNYFSAEGVDVKFYTKYLHKDIWSKVPVKFKKIKSKRKECGENQYFGKIDGLQIVRAIEEGIFDGGTIGESSFIAAVANGSPILAVAMLGRGESDRLRAIIMRKDVIINRPEDFKGKTLVSPRSGPFNYICLKEFIYSLGLDPDKDVTIIDGVPEDKLVKILEEKKADGGFYNLNELTQVVEKGLAYVYRKMDWIHPDLPHGLLVFRKDFVKVHPQEVEKIVMAYMKRLKYEKENPEEGQTDDVKLGFKRTLYFQGETFPQYAYPPFVSIDLLNEIEHLMEKYKVIHKQVDVARVINNGFVEKAYEQLQ